MSGLLTVWLQATWPLNPIDGNGEPKKQAPSRFQPSSLTMCPSYHWPGPKKGWCGLMNMSALPDADLSERTAHMLEPTCSDMLCRSCSHGRQFHAQVRGESDRADLVAVNFLNGREDIGSLQARLAVDERLIKDKAAKSERVPGLEVCDQPGFHLRIDREVVVQPVGDRLADLPGFRRGALIFVLGKPCDLECSVYQVVGQRPVTVNLGGPARANGDSCPRSARSNLRPGHR